MKQNVLIAGIGNIFLADDAFGSVVARRLIERSHRPEVRILDLGIRGFDLAFALLENYDLIVLIDLLPHSAPPGSIQVLELPLPAPLDARHGDPQTHGMTPVRALNFANHFGVIAKQIYLLGCAPENLLPNDTGDFSLSPAVEEAVEPAIKLVDELVEEFFRNRGDQRQQADQQEQNLCTN